MTKDEARRTIHRAWELGLAGAGFMSNLGAECVAESCNGIGPEWLPAAWREKLNKWLHVFRTACDIHDCRFSHANDGTTEKFSAWNDELEENCVKCADAEYAWYNPRRYLARRFGRRMADICRAFGWSAWEDAHDKQFRRPAVGATGQGKVN